MDPVSFVFSAYLNAVQSSAHNQVTGVVLGTEVKAVIRDSLGE